MSNRAGPPPSLPRRLATGLLTLIVVLVIPTVLAFLAAGPAAAGGAALGALLAFLVALMAGWRRSASFLVPTLVAVAASALLAGTIWWVVGLVLLGLLVGLFATRGLHVPAALLGIAWSVTQPTDPASDLAILVLFAALSGVYAILIARRMGVPAAPEESTVPLARALVGGLALGVAAGIAGVVTENWDVEGGYWLPMTVFVLAIPAADARLSQRAVTRVVGTAVGVGVAVTITSIIDVPLVDYGLALLTLMAALAIPTPRWLNAAFVAATIVFALSPTSGTDVGETRLGATIGGAVILIGTAGVLALIARFIPTTRDQRQQVDEFEEHARDDAESGSGH